MKNQLRLSTIVAIVFVAALSRLVPHPPNFTPIAAMALFGGAYLGASIGLSAAVVLGSMFVSDLLIGFDAQSPFVYATLVGIIFIGASLRGRVNFTSVLSRSLAGSALFFVVTNLGVWLVSGMYPLTVAGLATCFTLAVPFFGNTLMGDLFFNGMLFGLFFALERNFTVLSPARA